MPSKTNSIESVSKKQNLLSAKAYYMYIGKKAAVPAVIAVIVLVAVMAFAGKQFPSWTKNVQKKTDALNQKSRQEACAQADVEISNLEMEYESLEAVYNEQNGEYDVSRIEPDTSDDEELAEIRKVAEQLEEALQFDWNAPDADTTVRYEAQLLMKSIFQDIFQKGTIGDEELTGIAVTSLEDNRTGTTTGEWLHYSEDVSDTYFVLRGLCEDPLMLERFLIKLSACEYIDKAQTKSIEAKTITTDKLSNGDGTYRYVTRNLFVFEITIIPKVDIPETTAETDAATEDDSELAEPDRKGV